MPKFSIIAVDYEKTVPREEMIKGLISLATQTFKDFELVIVHDGPKEVPYEKEVDFYKLGLNPIILNTEKQMGQYGHNSRDLGMRHATGDYFIQFNINNMLYYNALEKISQKIDETNLPIIIFGIKHFKLDPSVVFSGVPPVFRYIDALQLVGSRNIWEEVGYWYDKNDTSDGFIYEELCKKYPWVAIEECLGENY